MSTPSHTPIKEADYACSCIEKLAAACFLNPAAYLREGKESVRSLESKLRSAVNGYEAAISIIQELIDSLTLAQYSNEELNEILANNRFVESDLRMVRAILVAKAALQQAREVKGE